MGEPRAHEHKVLLKPRLPSGCDRFAVTNVRIGQNSLDWASEDSTYRLTSREPGWHVTLNLPVSPDGRTPHVLVDNHPTSVENSEDSHFIRFETTGAGQIIEVHDAGA